MDNVRNFLQTAMVEMLVFIVIPPYQPADVWRIMTTDLTLISDYHLLLD